MPDKIPNYPKVTIQQLKGLNERSQFSQDDLGEFDWLKGFVPVNRNTLTRPEGCKLFLKLNEPIFGLCQTHDSRNNIIIQTQNNVYVISEEEFFDIVYTPTLTVLATEEPEIMAYARLIHDEGTGAGGGAVGAAFAQRPLNKIASQINADGTAATFVTLVANQFTLAAGVYRLAGGFIFGSTAVDAGVDKSARVRLYNVTAAGVAWGVGAQQEGTTIFVRDFKGNVVAHIGGSLVLAAPTIFEVQDKRESGAGTIDRGLPNLVVAGADVFGWIDIWKTA